MNHHSALAPIIVFVYNRKDHLEEMIGYLTAAALAKKSELYIFSDGAKNKNQKAAVEEVRAFVKTIIGFKTIQIIESPINKGLKRSVIEGVSHVLGIHDKIIVLEDDICVGQSFLSFMNNCLDTYENREDIWSVSGYIIPALGKKIQENNNSDVVLAQRASSWGWGTWKSRWENADWDMNKVKKKICQNNNFLRYYSTGGDKIRMLLNEINRKSNSWAIIWDFNHFLHNAFCVYPIISQVKNIGLDNSGVHSTPHPSYDVITLAQTAPDLPLTLKTDQTVLALFAGINRKWYRNIWDAFRYIKLKVFK